ncbi:MAG: hypothetical protein EXR73_08495 [Myxococcales bacterium]|nr:hypothetical protein [Myxococcales bacterium]
MKFKFDAGELRAYLNRDWALVARAKAEFWADRVRRLGLVEVLRAMSELRDHARALRPDWPTDQERVDDLQSHHRVAEALSKVPATAVRRRRRPRRVR